MLDDIQKWLFSNGISKKYIYQGNDLKEKISARFTSMQEGLKKCLTGFVEAYKEKNVFLPINWRNEAYRDRLTGEHSSFSEMKGWRNKLKYFLYRITWFMQYRCRG